jgi:citronellyl-CoA dehydrogenase
LCNLYITLGIVTEYGGLGLDFSYSVAVAEELGAINCGAIPMAIGVQTDMATPALASYVNISLLKHYLIVLKEFP